MGGNALDVLQPDLQRLQVPIAALQAPIQYSLQLQQQNQNLPRGTPTARAT